MEIMDISGKLIKRINSGIQSQGMFEQSIELSELDNGLYILIATIGENKIIKKFSKN